jgi:hypothetical protein
MPCLNCNAATPKDVFYCNWSCETCYLIRLEGTASYKGELKYPEYLDLRNDMMKHGWAPPMRTEKLKPIQYRPSFLC